MLPRTLITFEDLRKARRDWGSQTVAFVPTMGALHPGHISLVQKAKELADRVIVSIFVNPLQFGPREDFAKYPRTLAQDLDLLGPLEIDGVFSPNSNEMYPENFQTKVHNGRIGEILCGRSRPGHFDGVLTVVAKLFGLVSPTWALFGRKDFQQLKLIEIMVRDLMMNVRIVGCPIIREADGLAMSSRNRYIPEDKRAKAAEIQRGMQAVKARFATGDRQKAALLKVFSEHLHSFGDEFTIDYCEIRGGLALEEQPEVVGGDVVLLVAVFYCGVRLIDNIDLHESQEGK